MELAVSADAEAVETVSEILSRTCPGGVAVEPPFELVDEGLGARADLTAPVVVRGYVSALDARLMRAAVEQVERDLSHLQAFGLGRIGELATRLVHEEDWAEAWKRHFPVVSVGRRIVIVPTWREHNAVPGEVVIALDPGMAFGTGLHPTTRLCLAGLEALADERLLSGARALDVGCGSGILAICAGLLGAAQVHAVDTDPVAVEVTQANAARNDLREVITVERGGLPLAEPARFDVVLANLVAGVLIGLARQLADVVRPGGRLLAGGIFVDRESEVTETLADCGLQVVSRRTEGDWVTLDLVARDEQ